MQAPIPYSVRRPSESLWLPLRGMRLHLRRWGSPADPRPPLLLLHGWMDCAASWQFTVDALQDEDRQVLAPDWRGFGHSESPAADHYQFDEYLADLDALLRHLRPDGSAVDIAAHSMGGNVAMLYAGARPSRVRRLVNLEGFGMLDTPASDAATRHAQWLDSLVALEQGRISLNSYEDQAAVARRLQKTNPRLPADKALWLAGEWARPVRQPDGTERWHLRADAAHKLPLPRVYRADEALAHWAAITAPLLMVHASDDSFEGWWKGRYTFEDFQRRLAVVPDCRMARVEDAGHMLHHDQPEVVARVIEGFL